MATHLQIRDGSLVPLEGTFVTKNGSYIIFTLSNGSLIREYYNYGEEAMNAAYAAYTALLSFNATLSDSSPSSFQMLDSATGLPVTVSVINGVLTVVNGTTISSVAIIDAGNNLPSSIKVVNGVLTVEQ